ncbi:MAG: MBL fold metallo-hydrolase [Promethearchaeota archaeon]
MKLSDDLHFLEGIGFDSNIILITDEDEGITIFDTGHDEPAYLYEYIEKLGYQPKDIRNVCLTHVHIDHSGGLARIARRCNPKVHVFEKGAGYIENGDLEITLAGMFRGYFEPTHVDHELKKGEKIRFGSHEFEILHTPGHTSCSICYYDRDNKILISGDTVFADGSFGRVDFPTGDAKALMDSLKYLATLDVEMLLPGHMRPVKSGGRAHIAKSAKFCSFIL